MPLFTVHIDREVINYDRFTRIVEAPTEEDARKIAAKIADEANDDTPDDAGPGNFDDEFGDWSVNSVASTDAEDLHLYELHEPEGAV